MHTCTVTPHIPHTLMTIFLPSLPPPCILFPPFSSFCLAFLPVPSSSPYYLLSPHSLSLSPPHSSSLPHLLPLSFHPYSPSLLPSFHPYSPLSFHPYSPSLPLSSSTPPPSLLTHSLPLSLLPVVLEVSGSVSLGPGGDVDVDFTSNKNRATYNCVLLDNSTQTPDHDPL